jgi:YD repeat-containing protein
MVPGGLLVMSSTTRLTSRIEGTTQRALIQSVTTDAGVKTAYTYKDTTDDVGRLLKARTTDASNALVEEYAYTYDKAGNRLSKTRTTPSATTTTLYAYNAADQLCWRYTGSSASGCGTPPAGATTYGYDAAGNQTSGDRTTTYDEFGRISSNNGAGVIFNDLTQNEYAGIGDVRYQNTLIGPTRVEINPNTAILARHPQTGLAVSEIRAGTKRYLIYDAIGSTTGSLDATNGDPGWRFVCGPSPCRYGGWTGGRFSAASSFGYASRVARLRAGARS